MLWILSFYATWISVIKIRIGEADFKFLKSFLVQLFSTFGVPEELSTVGVLLSRVKNTRYSCNVETFGHDFSRLITPNPTGGPS